MAYPPYSVRCVLNMTKKCYSCGLYLTKENEEEPTLVKNVYLCSLCVTMSKFMPILKIKRHYDKWRKQVELWERERENHEG